jgi:hypothetical protein
MITISKQETSFILNGKVWGVGKTERESESVCVKESEMQSVGGKGLRHGS